MTEFRSKTSREQSLLSSRQTEVARRAFTPSGQEAHYPQWSSHAVVRGEVNSHLAIMSLASHYRRLTWSWPTWSEAATLLLCSWLRQTSEGLWRRPERAVRCLLPGIAALHSSVWGTITWLSTRLHRTLSFRPFSDWGCREGKWGDSEISAPHSWTVLFFAYGLFHSPGICF